jgi:hypothetical protein
MAKVPSKGRLLLEFVDRAEDRKTAATAGDSRHSGSRLGQGQVFHGALPSLQISFRYWYSR